MAGRGMNYGRPRGRGHGGGTCVRGPSSDELAQIRHDREAMSRDSMYCKRIFGLRVLKEKAAAGDRAAQVKLLKGKAKYAMATEPSRKKVAAKWEAWRAEQVPKGHKRIKRRDPETGEWHEHDLPIPGCYFERVMIGVQRGVARCDLVNMTSEQWEFLLYGRNLKA